MILDMKKDEFLTRKLQICFLDMKKNEFLTRKLQIYFFGYEKEWENCRFETFINK